MSIPATYQRIVLASRPRGPVTPENFRLETVPVPQLAAGEVLIRNHYLSLDPYMRGRMSAAKSYASSQQLDQTMIGGTVGQVLASRNELYQVGDYVNGVLGWAEMGVSDGVLLRKLDATRIPLSAFLGVVGMPGMAAWYGFNQIMQAAAGETVVVSAASGAVGSVVGQLARLRGCRVVGIAGGQEKCDYVVRELGFDACVDYKAGNLEADLAAATPDGVDAIFENVGGACLDAALARTNAFARVALCGLIAGFNGGELPIKNARLLLINRLTLRGFIITEHMEYWPQGLQELAVLVANGQIKYRESVADGLAAAPEAFMGLLQGRNFGKQLVKLI
ncbi:zinc-binding dehydrogenase [Duganella sp. FT80W]|uniref:Zinc-binding dehydrogenase n=1 Tax=Duganella guangzhouensis TaxID=2666084 RepID=A0A6I2L427_9BURK|nr:NADP-dependent oxidoreductase [Duganella guangzhouensis]MRW91907.1 zinc-binding dehydrogenase [Duganella guangzhouensis]